MTHGIFGNRTVRVRHRGMLHRGAIVMHREATVASECVLVLEEVLSQPTLLGYVTWEFSAFCY